MAMNKNVVATVCVVISAGAIAGGLWLRASTAPLALPTNSEDALAGLTSNAYAKMDDQRRRQYAAEAMKHMRDMSPEERELMRERFQNEEEFREAMRRARQDMFDEMARRAARGAPMERPEPRGDRPQRPDPSEMTDEQREQMRERMEAMRERMTQAMKDSWDTGDAQSSGLRQEMFKNRGPGGGRRGGGGGR